MSEHHCPGCKGFTPAWDECHGDDLEEIVRDYARCNLDGRPVHPGDQAIIDRFAAWLAMTPAERKHVARNDPEWQRFLGIGHPELVRAGPLLQEQADGYLAEWYCEPPGEADSFRIPPDGEEWAEADGQPVRRIFAIERITDAPQEPGSARAAERDGPAGPGPGSPGPGPEAPAAPA